MAIYTLLFDLLPILKCVFHQKIIYSAVQLVSALILIEWKLNYRSVAIQATLGEKYVACSNQSKFTFRFLTFF